MSRSLPRKQPRFDAAKAAFERVTGTTVEGYVCPICVRACSTLDDVTLEDVRPRNHASEQRG